MVGTVLVHRGWFLWFSCHRRFVFSSYHLHTPPAAPHTHCTTFYTHTRTAPRVSGIGTDRSIVSPRASARTHHHAPALIVVVSCLYLCTTTPPHLGGRFSFLHLCTAHCTPRSSRDDDDDVVPRHAHTAHAHTTCTHLHCAPLCFSACTHCTHCTHHHTPHL